LTFLDFFGKALKESGTINIADLAKQCAEQLSREHDIKIPVNTIKKHYYELERYIDSLQTMLQEKARGIIALKKQRRGLVQGDDQDVLYEAVVPGLTFSQYQDLVDILGDDIPDYVGEMSHDVAK